MLNETQWRDGRDPAALFDHLVEVGLCGWRLRLVSANLGLRGWSDLPALVRLARHLADPHVQPYGLVADLLREVFGNPFRRVSAAALGDWLTPLVRDLARAAREHHVLRESSRLDHGDLDPVRLGIVADALEEQGCVGVCRWCGGSGGIDPLATGAPFPCHACDRTGHATHPLLEHLRDGDVTHIDGCWALDLLVGDR